MWLLPKLSFGIPSYCLCSDERQPLSEHARGSHRRSLGSFAPLGVPLGLHPLTPCCWGQFLEQLFPTLDACSWVFSNARRSWAVRTPKSLSLLFPFRLSRKPVKTLKFLNSKYLVTPKSQSHSCSVLLAKTQCGSPQRIFLF